MFLLSRPLPAGQDKRGQESLQGPIRWAPSVSRVQTSSMESTENHLRVLQEDSSLWEWGAIT